MTTKLSRDKFFYDSRMVLADKILHLRKTERDQLELIFWFYDIISPGEQRRATVTKISERFGWSRKYVQKIIATLRRKRLIYPSVFKNQGETLHELTNNANIRWVKLDTNKEDSR